MSAATGNVPSAVLDGIHEIEERVAFLSVACFAMAEAPDATMGLLYDKALRGLAWWTQDIENGLRTLNELASKAVP